jgi:asparagine synthase (glutamine-hydrolysing)
MCGIAGFLQIKAGQGLRESDLREMTAAIKHRGPDDDGFYVKSPVGLGMRRLSIVDLPGGAQPISNERGSVWTVFNGEIYNYEEIRKDLEAAGHTFQTKSDTEVLVHGYEEWGEGFLGRLRGMYAFALWDETFQKLLLVRDPFGIKPLYYATHAGCLMFGSEIKALLAVKGFPRRPDTRALMTLLTLQYIPSPDTAFKGVRKLPPGHMLVCQKGKISVRPFWNLPGGAEVGGEMYGTEREWVDALRLRLFASVKEQLMADVPVGAFLSGGVDSSLIVASVVHQTHKAIRTYSVGFPGTGDAFNELSHARKVAKLLQCPHREMTVEPGMLPDLMPRLSKFLDDPVVDPAVIPTFLVSLFARQEVKVVLSGEGADELFGGYRRYAFDQNLGGTARKMPGWFRNRLMPFFLRKRNERVRQAWEALSETDLLKRHMTWARLSTDETLKTILGPKLEFEAESLHVEESFAKVLEEASHRPGGDLNRMLYLDLKTWLPDDLLNKVDRMSMAASLEARVPYLDPRLVEFAFQVPEKLKVKGATGKYLLKEAARMYLPNDIVDRPKQGFAVPLAPWFRNELKPILMDTLSEDRLKRRGLFDPKGVQNLIQAHMSGKEDHHLILFGLLMIEWWYDEFFKS